MVDQPLGQVGQHQFAVGHGDEAVAKGMEPELRSARLADARVQVLHAAVDPARAAGLRRKHPDPAVLGKALALGETAFEDGGELARERKLQRLAGLGLLDPERHRREVHLCPAQPEHLGAAHAGVEAEAEGVAGDRIANRGLDAAVPAGQHLRRRRDAAAALAVEPPARGAPLVHGVVQALDIWRR